MLSVIIFIGVIVLLIFAHELGHFITAKLSGVKVEEFGIGFPPRLFAIKRGETEYSINLIPMGGFCKMLGEEDPELPRSLASKGTGTRLLVLSAGSIMNALLPILLFSISFMIPKEVMVEQVIVEEVALNSPAERAGLLAGDIILSIDNRPIKNRGDLIYNIQLNLGSEVAVGVERGGIPQAVRLTPRWNPPELEGPIGIMLPQTPLNASTDTVSYPIWQAFPKGAHTTWDTFVLFKNEVTTWLMRRALPQLAGPIGIAQMTGEVAEAGLSPLLAFTAFISINLAIINLLPIPGLDGGRIIFVILEWLRRGKRIPPKWEGLIHLIGFALLLMVIVIVSYYDILRIINGESLMP